MADATTEGQVASLADLLYPYVVAWAHGEETGNPEFDACCHSGDVAKFLARIACEHINLG